MVDAVPRRALHSRPNGNHDRRAARVLALLFPLSVILTLLLPSIASAEEYVVRSGDSLWGIARRYEMTTSELAASNRIANPSRISVGQRLTVPWTELTVREIPAAEAAKIRRWDDRTRYFARAYHVDPDLIRRVMYVESRGNQWSKSYAGAIGLMQVMPFWFKPSENPWNSWTNIGKGAYILRYGHNIYKSWLSAVAWYFHGSLARFGGRVPTYYTNLVFPR